MKTISRKRILSVIAFLFISLASYSQIKTPLPSPGSSVVSTVGLTEVKIEYFRPQTKGRKVFGEGDEFLVPNGKLWRTGANGGTKVTFEDDVTIGGKTLAAGTYQLLTIPSKKEWQVIFYSDLTIGGNMSAYDQAKDALRISAPATKISEPVTTLTFNVSDISENSQNANLELVWENTSVKVPFLVTFHERVMADIAKGTKVSASNYAAAARYYLANNTDLEQALEWMDMYLAEKGNEKHFWQVHVKAKILAKLGNKKEAIKVAKLSKELATNNEGGDFGYIKRNNALIASLK